MSRLSTLFVLGGAGLLLTPLAASAQHIRAFGLPHGRPPLTVPIVPPISVVPTVRIVPPVPLVRPVIGWPHGHFVYTTQYHLGNLSFNTTTVAFGAAAWKFSPTAAAIVAASCDVVTVTDSRTPSGGTPGPRASIHVDSAAGTFLPWSVQSFVVSPRP